MRKTYLLAILIVILFFLYQKTRSVPFENTQPFRFWSIQSIDTMKYSRDLAREKLTDSTFDKTIDTQVSLIASTGATHIAIDTPYDEEFIPFLKRWVNTARKYNLKVWFRGNLSGWEGWFDYKKITSTEHTTKIIDFIKNNPDLFTDGDLFSSCPECENGGPGDPRQTGKVGEYRQFLVREASTVKTTFASIHKAIPSNLNSMNGDVAKLIMDKETTKALGGFVAIDHYVATPEQLVSDIHSLIKQSGGQIIVAEFGAPIPNIQGDMTEDMQSQWLENTLNLLKKEKGVVGLNYWTNVGSSTSLWNNDGSPKKAVDTLTLAYKPHTVIGRLVTWLNIPIKNALITADNFVATSDSKGYFQIPKEGNSNLFITQEYIKTITIPITSINKITVAPTSLLGYLNLVLQ